MNNMQQLRIHSLSWSYYQIVWPASRIMSSKTWLFQRKKNRLSRPMHYCFCQKRSSSSIFSVLSPEVAKLLERPVRGFQDEAITSYLTILGISKVNECSTMFVIFFFPNTFLWSYLIASPHLKKQEQGHYFSKHHPFSKFLSFSSQVKTKAILVEIYLLSLLVICIIVYYSKWK